MNCEGEVFQLKHALCGIGKMSYKEKAIADPDRKVTESTFYRGRESGACFPLSPGCSSGSTTLSMMDRFTREFPLLIYQIYQIQYDLSYRTEDFRYFCQIQISVSEKSDTLVILVAFFPTELFFIVLYVVPLVGSL